MTWEVDFSLTLYIPVRVAKISSSANFAQSRSCGQPCYRPFALIFEVSLQSLSSDLLKPYALRLLSKVGPSKSQQAKHYSLALQWLYAKSASELMLATLPNHHATPTPRNSNLRIQKLGFPTMARRISLTACWDCAALLQLETRSIPVMRLGDFFL